MMQSRKVLRASFCLLALSSTTFAAEDAKVGKQTYYGSGYVEAAPEYAEVNFQFNVQCRKSAADVHQAITAESAVIWQAIQSKVTANSETERAQWGDVGAINAQPDSVIRQPTDKRGNVIAGAATRVSICDGKPVSITTLPGRVYGGVQMLGVRVGVDKMPWLEGLVAAVEKRKAVTKRSDVVVSHTGLRYGVTGAKSREMEVEAQRQAREAALGANSLFQSDRKNLRYESAHFLGQRVQSAPYYDFNLGSSLRRGAPTKVSLDLPFVYTIYAEGADRIDPNNARGSVGLESEYKLKGHATADADFAETNVTIRVACQPSAKDALAVLKNKMDDVQPAIEKLMAGKTPSEKDRLTYSVPSSASQHYPYAGITFDATQKATELLDLCTGERKEAPANGDIYQLPPYSEVQVSYNVKSSDFAAVIDLVESLRKKHVAQTATTEALVTVSDATGGATLATKQRLIKEAREYATSCVLDPKGSLANDASALGFKCAHLKNIRVEFEGPVRKGGFESPRGRSAGAEAAFDAAPGASPESLNITEVYRDGETRPRKSITRDYAFDFQVVSRDYVPELKTQAIKP